MRSGPPRLVHYGAAIGLPLPQHDHPPPIRFVDSVHEPTGFNAEAREGPPGRVAVNGGHVGAGAGVELEGGLGAVHLQVDARARMLKLSQEAQGPGARVQRDGGDVLVHDEDVVEGGVVGPDGKRLGDAAGEGLDGAGGDAGLVEGQVLRGYEAGGGAGDGGVTAEVEVAVVGQVDDGLGAAVVVAVVDEFGLILDGEDGAGGALDGLFAAGVEDLEVDGAGESGLEVRGPVGVEEGVVAVAAHPGGALEVATAPAATATVEGVGGVVGFELVAATVEVLDDAVLDAVGDATDGGTEPGGVVSGVEVFIGEPKDEVLAVDVEFLDDGTEVGELDGVGIHDGWGICSL